MMDQALTGVKVIDLTWQIAGPFCTKLLADYGADVIKIEMPGTGDPARKMGPFLHNEPHPEKCGLFLHLNTNKRGITVNLKSNAGKKILRELIREADILVENFSPGVMGRLGLSYEELEKINPKLVMTSISNYGQTGPYRDFKMSDTIAFAMGGAMSSQGVPEREPVAAAQNLKLHESAYYAATGTLGAWFGARQDGIGELVDVSIMETLMGSSDRRDNYILSYSYTGYSTTRTDPVRFRGRYYPVGPYPCKDGWVHIAMQPSDWPRYLKTVGKEEWLSDPRWSNFFDLSLLAESDGAFIEWLADRTKQEAAEIMQAAGVLCMPFNTLADLYRDPHFKARGFWVEIDHPVTGRLTYPGAPTNMMDGGYQVRRPAPLLGQHNEEVLCGMLGYSKEDLVFLRETGAI